MKNYDFGGWATKNDLRCSDGRVIRRGAFKECDGETVPLVYQHNHSDMDNVVGHALLKNRPEGVYAYCYCNDTQQGKNAKELVKHGDITALSIYANRLQQSGSDVLHGAIKEVSLVLAGANPGAYIDDVNIVHSDDDTYDFLEDTAVITTGDSLDLFHSGIDTGEDTQQPEDQEQTELAHADDKKNDKEKTVANDQTGNQVSDDSNSEETVQDVFDTLTDKQKQVVYYIIGQALEKEGGSDADEKEAAHSDMEDNYMHANVFDGTAENNTEVLSQSEMADIFAEARHSGSLKETVLQHGITDIDVLFPDAQATTNQPQMISRRMEWVNTVLSGAHKSPFSRVKTVAANITEDEARAKGYIKGKQKKEEVFPVLKRVTTPQTVYKLQKLDRDDIIDITDFDVVAWMKGEMRVMLDEELARAALIGDGRTPGAEDKINESNIRPIWTDDELYAIHTTVTEGENDEATALEMIDAFVKAADQYRGSGNPTLFIGRKQLTAMRLLKDKNGYRLYKSDQELADDLRVSKIVPVELFDDQTRSVSGKKRKLGGIVVNMSDYTFGSTRGGEVNLFDDFDLDYNKYEYLIETRCCGALTVPYSALVVELEAATAGSTSQGN